MTQETRPKDNMIGKYRLGREIGRGGMGIVYKAVDTRSDRTVAFKVLPAGMVDRTGVIRFQREGQAQARLRHQNIVEVYEVGSTTGTHYMAMEFVEGKTLKSTVRRTGNLTVEMTLDIARQVLRALEYAHGMGFIHRDVKPANIMVTDQDVVKLMDFGVSKTYFSEEFTLTGFRVGVVNYTSPEQI